MWTIVFVIMLAACCYTAWKGFFSSTPILVISYIACIISSIGLCGLWGIALFVGWYILVNWRLDSLNNSEDSNAGTTVTSYSPQRSSTASSYSSSSTGMSSRSSSHTISMNNPQVAALADEVVKVCNDMFEAGLGMTLYSAPRGCYEGHVFFFVDYSDHKSNVEIYMNNVGIPQSVSGLEASTPIGERYNRFLQEYQQCYAPDSFQNRYIYRARTRVSLSYKSDADTLMSLLCTEIRNRCHLAQQSGNGSFHTKNIAH